MKRLKSLNKVVSLTLATMLMFSVNLSTKTMAASPIKLIVDGKDITSLSSPVIENDRTLVPIRFVSEELGAIVTWNNDNRTVKVEKGNDTVLLRIDSHLVEYNNGSGTELSDVAPKIINDRTFVPLRLISNALGIGIEWDNSSRTVNVDSSKTSEKAPFFDVKIISHNPGQVVTGKTELQIGTSEIYLKDGNEIKFLLLDPDTAKGFIVARGSDITSKYTWIPKIEDKGNKVLVGAIYDKNGKFVAGHSIPVSIDVVPSVKLTGLQDGQVIDGNTSIATDVNFVAKYVKYEITNLSNGKVIPTDDVADPQGPFTWSPTYESNGNYSIKAIAYDLSGNSYESTPVNVQVSMVQKLSLSGVTPGATINRAVTLLASRNYNNVVETEYLIKDVNTGVVSTLAKIPYGGYKWFPGPEFSGVKELTVRVKDTRGGILESSPIRVTVNGSPIVLLEGIGPKQVVTGDTKLKVTSNMTLDSVNYILINSKTGAKRVLASNINPNTEYTYTPAQGDIGDVIIQAEGIYEGKKILSEQVPFRVFLGQTYGPKPVIERDKFLGLASGLARTSYENTGMSAALQTAQAILETGWGQSVPVDKYSGVLSNNLFGIKGQGPAGSVISNTWEVYNGITYRVDAEFRAYKDVGGSWADHKEFLLNRERYAPLKLVMYDYAQGAWALKRAGYATDPQYPIKLMNLIKQYNLMELDKVGI